MTIPPKVWCDGVHDDSEALQWYLDSGFEPPWGRNLLSRPLIVDKNTLI